MSGSEERPPSGSDANLACGPGCACAVGNEFDLEQKRRNFEYYDPITTGDSTLSACVQGIMAAEVGHPGAGRGR